MGQIHRLLVCMLSIEVLVKLADDDQRLCEWASGLCGGFAAGVVTRVAQYK